VRFKDGRQHIMHVKIFDISGDHLVNDRIISRVDVISFLKYRRSIKTIFQRNGSWNWGEDVRIMSYAGSEFIRTDNNSHTADNLGNLPEF
jgi:hypothetical protein